MKIPHNLIAQLPPPGSQGYSLVDVKVHNRWIGTIAVDPNGQLLGVKLGAEIEQLPDDFSPDQVADVRIHRRALLLRNAIDQFLKDPLLISLYCIVMYPVMFTIIAIIIRKIARPIHEPLFLVLVMFILLIAAVQTRNLAISNHHLFVKIGVAFILLIQVMCTVAAVIPGILPF